MDLDRCGDTISLSPSKIICMLRNYRAHASELNNPVPDRINFFLKPPSSLLREGGSIIKPTEVVRLHHEVELAVVMADRCRDLTPETAIGHVLGYMLMLDLTARDIQDDARSKGLPWTQAKGYDTFAPYLSRIVGPDEFDWRDRRIYLLVNSMVRQEGNTSDMVFPVEDIICYVSRIMTLERGDIIMTGTPSGVGPLNAGDEVRAGIEGIGEALFNVIDQM
ncbi:MAG: fumarylacetoacetate hydrolase family protein [Candidatus Thermoplasmatota archaeon]|nr:fumarylacetoacetate hydrolase family protein [Candidatus Thermoplasmatota archaeon]